MTIADNVMHLMQLIEQTELLSNRKPGSVLLMAVSKQQNSEAIRTAFQAGIEHYGENYFQEAHVKINELKDLPLCWHFIGPVQSNKTKGIATSFDWVHSVNRLKIAQLLNTYRNEHPIPLNVCLQINLVDEATKAGISPEQAGELALQIQQLPHLKLRGLMTIPPPHQNPQQQYELLSRLQQLFCSINNQLKLNMDTLSMGMSDDLIPAIKAGATIVRIGRALFGERQRT